MMTFPALPTITPLLETERLILRVPALDDAPAINTAIAESMAELSRWMPWARNPQSLGDTERFVQDAIAWDESRDQFSRLMVEKANGRVLGALGLHDIDWGVPRFEIGYWLRTSAVGHGFVTEAVRRLTTWAFEELGAMRVEIRCDSRNLRSAAVAERAGYRLEAVLRQDSRANDGSLRDTRVYARLAAP